MPDFDDISYIARAFYFVQSSQIISQTECWVKSVIIECNFCPFAKRELERGSIRYRVIKDKTLEDCLHSVIEECVFLDSNNATETTLLIFPKIFSVFDDYLQLVEMAGQLIAQQAYEGIYQLASFHPDYVFENSAADDAANTTNRSPYPMLHLIREASIEKVLATYPEPENIPQRNIKYARDLGLDTMKAKLNACLHGEKK